MRLCPSEWKRTRDLFGHAPKFTVSCTHCGATMVVRHTRLMLQGDKTSMPANVICYKCPNCAWLVTFEVTDDVTFLRRVARKRHGALFYVPATEVWADESPEIAEKLQSLGYFGG